MNLKFVISYDGSVYQGSQKQLNGNTVEDNLLSAFKCLNINTKIILSGRTDKKVHSTGQVFNCQVPSFWNDFGKLKKNLNKNLPSSIKILKITEIDSNFHSRFSAKKRIYRYLITTKETSPFNERFITYVEKINEILIKSAIKEFIGEHDFKYFHKQGSDKENTTRIIYDAKFYKYKNIFVFKFIANSYLRSQIRIMVGFLLAINRNKLTIDDLKNQLKCNKRFFNTPANPNGLYLTKIIY